MELDEFIELVKEQQGIDLSGVLTTADKIGRPERALEKQAIIDFENRNPMAGGGMLVQPSADGRRPGYSVDKRNNNYRVTGKRGDITYGQWANENNLPQTFPTKKEAEAAQKKFYEAVTKKSDISKAKWVDEITALSNEFNTKVIKDFNKGDMSKTPAWKNFLENKKLKHGSSGFYRSLAPEYGVINTINKKAELLDKLITNANNSLKYTPWMSIQKKISTSPVINTSSYRTYIDALDTQADKASKAFDYLLNNDIELKVPKNLSKTMAAEGSLLRKVIHGLTGVNTRGIRLGLNQNKNFKNNFDKIEFARRGNLLAQGEGRTLKDIIDNADYRMKGNISWTSDIKLSNRANKNVFDYALRNFNYHQLNKTGEGTIQFYDKKTNKPINWDTLPKNKNGFRVLKPNSVYFIDANDPNRTKWDMSKIDADNMKWSKGTGSSGLFDEVFQAKDKYDNLLATKVEDPRNPKKKISFGKLMSEVYQIGFSNFGNPYNIEHADGVANNPFKNLKIASGRVNQALSSLNRDTKLRKSEKNKIFKELQKNVFSPADKNMIDNLIKSTEQLQSDVLIKKQTFDQSEIQRIITSFSSNPQCTIFSKKTKAAADGGRIGYQTGTVSLSECVKDGAKNFQEGKFKTKDQAMDAARLLSGSKNALRTLTKYGILPEAAFVAGESIFRTVLGEKPLDAIKKSIDSFTFGVTDFTSGIEAAKFGKDANRKLAVDKFKESQAKVNKLEKQIAGLDQIGEAKKFGYGVDNSEIMRMTKEKLEAAKKELEQNYVSPDLVQYIDRKAENIADAQEAKSPIAKSRFKENMNLNAINLAKERDKSQMDLNIDMFPNFRNYVQSEEGQKDKIFMNTPDEVIKKIVGEEGIEFKKQLTDAYKMENLKNKFGAEQIYGTQGVFSQPLAGGGIAKLAGVNQGPPPESGPNSQGLQGLFNRVKKV